MAKAKNKTTPAKKVTPVAPDVEDNKQPSPKEIITIGLYKNKSGWRFIKITTLGDKVVNREETDHDTLRAYCFDELKIQAIKTYMGDTY